MKNMSKLLGVLLLLTCLLLVIGGTAQAVPVQTAAPISGEIEAISLTNPADIWSGGTITVGGQVIILPANLLINLPNDYQTLQQLYANAPAVCKNSGVGGAAETGLAKSDLCNSRATGANVSILANRTNSGNIIAGQVDIFKALESVAGTITYIDTAGGYFRVNGVSGDATQGVMVRVNDPAIGPAPLGGRHTVQSGPGCAPGNTQNCSPDTRFKVDPDNYTFCFITGFPACIPGSANDPNCPATNRPDDPAAVGALLTPAVPVVAADSRHFAPIKLGDSVKADGAFETIGGVTFLSASSVRIYTEVINRETNALGQPDLTQPDYMIINEAGWDGPAYPAGRVRGRYVTTNSSRSSDLDYFSIHYDPVNNAPHEQILYTTQFNKQQGAVIVNANTGVFDSQIRFDFMPLAKALDNAPCMALTQGFGVDPKKFTGIPVVKDLNNNVINLSNYCTSSQGSPQDFIDNYKLMVPVFREIMARSTRSHSVTGQVTDIHGRPAQSGQYKLPNSIEYGAFEDINLGMTQFPVQFSGNPWLLDRRLSPNGCIGACEATQQPLTPFPFEGIDPRAVAPAFGFTGTVLPVQDRMFTYMTAAGSMTGQLTWPPPSPPAFPIVTPVLNLFPPFADEDAAVTTVGVPVIINVAGNDIATNGILDVLSVKLAGVAAPSVFATLPSGATVQVNPNGTITYTPAATFAGIDSFSYTIANTAGSVSLPGVVTVDVRRAPVAVDDVATVAAKGSPLAINVTANDVAGTSPLNLASVIIAAQPAAGCGSIVNQFDGVILYTPPTAVPAGGTCTFRYAVSDVNAPALTSNAAFVTVTITQPEAPVAVNDNTATTTGASVVIPVLANDTSAASPINPATVAVGAPTGGTVAANPDGTVTYTAPATVGVYTFSYTVKNSSATPTVSNSALVTVTVTQGHIAPVANNDSANATTGQISNINVLGNDSASAGSSLNPSSLLVTVPTGGTAAAKADGTVDYTPPGVPGTYTFTYTVKDNFTPPAVSNSATVTVNVAASNNVPTGTISINGGAAFTKSASVTLTLSATSVNGPATQMQFNKDGSAFTALEPFAATRAVTLLPGEGAHTIGVRYTDSAGKTSATISASIIVDSLPPTGTLSINGGALLTNSTTVTLGTSATDPNGVTSMQFSNDGINFFSPVPYATSATINLLPGNGIKTVLVRYIDAAGNVSPSISSTITFISPVVGTIQIDGGANVTGSTAAVLTLSASSTVGSITQMQFSKDGGVTWTAWETYATTRNVTLTPAGDGLKSVAVRYKDSLGNVSDAYSANITLSTAPPTGTILINGGAAFTSSTIVTLTLSATAVNSSVTQMQFSKDGGVTWTAFEPYATTRTVTLSTGDGVKTVAVKYRDSLGNVSVAYSASITLSNAQPTGTILINGGAAFTSSTIVTLTLSATAVNSSVTQMQFSKDGGVTWTAFEPYATSRNVTLLPAGDGLKTIAVKYMDSLGNVSVPYSASITVSTVPPTGSILINGGAATTNSATVTLTLSATAVNSSVSQMQFSKDGGVTWTAFEPYATTRDVTLTPPGPGTKTVAVQYKDSLGNVSPSYQASILLQ